jgi:hypothetical protein
VHRGGRFGLGRQDAPLYPAALGKGGAGTPLGDRPAASPTGAPSPVLIGARFALEPGRGRTSVPVRSVLLANMLAVAIVAPTFNFGSGLSTLVSHPRLYGWNWDYALQGYPVPPQSLSLLAKDPAATWPYSKPWALPGPNWLGQWPGSPPSPQPSV